MMNDSTAFSFRGFSKLQLTHIFDVMWLNQKQWSSNVDMHKNHLDILLKYSFLGPASRNSGLADLDVAQGYL